MYLLEPHFAWRGYYIASEDALSPFYGREYSEFEFTHAIYDHVIHPQWDHFGSDTLYLKILYSDYDRGSTVIEMMGEWDDCLYNDIMFLKRNVIEVLMENGIDKFILIGENVLNFHHSDDSYYQEWFEELGEGWIAAINFREHVKREFSRNGVAHFLGIDRNLDHLPWRNRGPLELFLTVRKMIGE